MQHEGIDPFLAGPCLLLPVAAIFAAEPSTQFKYPAAPISDQVDDYSGTNVADPYRPSIRSVAIRASKNSRPRSRPRRRTVTRRGERQPLLEAKAEAIFAMSVA